MSGCVRERVGEELATMIEPELVSKSQEDRVSKPEQVDQSEPGTKLQSLNVKLGMGLGSNLVCQSL